MSENRKHSISRRIEIILVFAAFLSLLIVILVMRWSHHAAVKVLERERTVAWQEHMENLIVIAETARRENENHSAALAETFLWPHVDRFPVRFAVPGVQAMWALIFRNYGTKYNAPVPENVIDFVERQRSLNSAFPARLLDAHERTSSRPWVDEF